MIDFVTGNKIKFNFASKIFGKYGLSIQQNKLDIPEIQAYSSEEVVINSAKVACQILDKPVIVNDVGYYISALNGFPGPYIKYMNKWLSNQDILNLMINKSDRQLKIVDILGYCRPNKEPLLFKWEQNASIIDQSLGESRTLFDSIIIREGMEKTQASYTFEELEEYFLEKLYHYHDLAKFLINEN
jgi:XTP/dITP diphosphohydrolase